MIVNTIPPSPWWSQWIVPIATLLASLVGVSLAFKLHKGNERKQLKRAKAEELLSCLLDLKMLLRVNKELQYTPQNEDSEFSRLFSQIQVLIIAYFPEYGSDVSKRVSNTNLIEKIYQTKKASRHALILRENYIHVAQIKIMKPQEGKTDKPSPPTGKDKRQEANEEEQRKSDDLMEAIDKVINELRSKIHKFSKVKNI